MGHSLHFRTSVRQRKPGYLFYPYIDFKNSISQKSHPNPHQNTKNTPKSLRYRLRANQPKLSISPLFTPSKKSPF